MSPHGELSGGHPPRDDLPAAPVAPVSTEDAMFEIGLFGTTHVRAGSRVLRFDDLPATKPRQLLEILAIARGAIVCKPALADRLWAGGATARWQAALDTHVSVLRRALQPGVAGRRTVVRTTAGGYQLDMDVVRLD